MAQSQEVAPLQLPEYLLEAGEPLVPIGELKIDISDFTSGEFHEREVAGLWTNVWQMACRANDIPEVGDYLEYEIAGLSILVVRQARDTIKAFRNTCRHRGTAVATGCGRTKHFVCPFHGWAYGLDGRLVARPSDGEFTHAPKAEYGLFPVRVEEFDGWVFINLDDKAPQLKEYLGETIMRHLRMQPSERMWKVYHLGMVVPSNWKVMAEAFFEAYHTNYTHPTMRLDYGGGDSIIMHVAQYGMHHRIGGLNGVEDLAQLRAGDEKSTDSSQFVFDQPVTDPELVSCRIAALRAFFGQALKDEPLEFSRLGAKENKFINDKVRQYWTDRGLDLSTVTEFELLEGMLYMVFPNFMTFRSPVGHGFYRFRPNVHDHRTMIFDTGYLTPVAQGEERPKDTPLHMLSPGEKLEDYSEQMGYLGFLVDQDVSNSPKIQRGIESRLSGGRDGDPRLREFVLAEDQEPNVVAFHRHLHHWLETHST